MKKYNLILMLVAVFGMTFFAARLHATDRPLPVQNTTLIDAAITTGAGTAYEFTKGLKSFSASGTTSSGSGAATVKLQCSATGVANTFADIVTITLTLATTISADLGTVDISHKFCRGNVTAISGTNATVTAILGN